MTSLIRWNSRPVLFRDDVDKLFDSLSREWVATFTPAVDIEESQDAFVLHFDVPGIDAKDVKVQLLGDTLTIRGERKEHARESRNMHRVERAYGTFERSFTLGVPVQSDQVRATYRDGVLEVRVPKAEEAKVREIDIQVQA